jgi:hypothetical protein
MQGHFGNAVLTLAAALSADLSMPAGNSQGSLLTGE